MIRIRMGGKIAGSVGSGKSDVGGRVRVCVFRKSLSGNAHAQFEDATVASVNESGDENGGRL